jgi:hypothetical protein
MATREKVYLGIPCYDTLEQNAYDSISYAFQEHDFGPKIEGHSALTLTYNQHVCVALNSRKQYGWTRFAMHHSDIQAQKGWGDILERERIKLGLDVLSAVMPIKSKYGVTSTAVWKQKHRQFFRLTQKQLFGGDNAKGTHVTNDSINDREDGDYLAINNGLMIFDINSPWVKQWLLDEAFWVKNFVTEDANGNFIPHFISEDWLFSKWLNEHGLKYGATKLVEAFHWGKKAYPNQGAWGEWEVDGHTRPGVLYEHYGPDGWFSKELADVDGWLSDDEGRCLANWAIDKRVLEIGCYAGRSTIWMARTARMVDSVDTFEGTDTDKPCKTLSSWLANMERYELQHRTQYHIGYSRDVVPDLPYWYDLAFIDGSHVYEEVKQDISLSRQKLRDGGLLAFHDYKRAIDPGVTQAVDELLAEPGSRLLEMVGTVAIVRPARL